MERRVAPGLGGRNQGSDTHRHIQEEEEQEEQVEEADERMEHHVSHLHQFKSQIPTVIGQSGANQLNSSPFILIIFFF